MAVDISTLSETELKQLLFRTTLKLQGIESFLINGGTGTRKIFIEYDVDNSQIRVRATLDAIVSETDVGAQITVGSVGLS